MKKKITKTAEDNPIPNHKIANGIHAIGGTGLRTLITKEQKLSQVSDQPKNIPIGIATTEAKIIPKNTLIKVLTVLVNNSPLAIKVHPALHTSIGLGIINLGQITKTSVIKNQANMINIGKTKGNNFFFKLKLFKLITT